MKIYPKFRAEIQDKKIVIISKKSFSQYIEKLKDKKVLITIEEEKTPRSLSQNAYYWVILRIISQDTGMNEDEIHSAMKMKFLRRNYVREDKKLETVRSTTSLSTQEFSEYIDRVKEFALDFFQIIIPNPEDLNTDENQN